MPTTTQTPDKVVLTNRAALKAKYGAAGLQAIDQALARMVAADDGRGLATHVIALDDKPTMVKLAGKPITKPADPKQAKAAVDAVCRKLRPDYVVLLGSIDVIPHQNLKNPIAAQEDADRTAWSDLPYACEAAYSTTISAFLEPTRVVGRLPDITASQDVDPFVARIDTAASYVRHDPDDYDAYLGITAAIWTKSSKMSVRQIFGSTAQLEVSPPDGPEWPADAIRRRAHFINCHGAPADPCFYGEHEDTGEQPVAHDAALIAGKIRDGTIVAAECCYGAELYDPVLSGGQHGMVDTYLAGGAYAFFGSSTIAYGPSDENAEADLICQYFLKEARAGASLGRAVLEARHQFIRTSSPLSPLELKTLAQFHLMGDPSIHAVRAATPHALAPAGAAAEEGARRKNRRHGLGLSGVATGRAATFAVDQSLKPRPDVRALLDRVATQEGAVDVRIATYPVEGARVPQAWKSAKTRGVLAIHVAVGKRPVRVAHKVPQLVVITAFETPAGLHLRRSYSR